MKALDLPLHGGSCPKWLFNKMVDLSAYISEFIIDSYGKKEFIKRFSDKYWLQALGSVLGFDWHSSGLTTTTLAALKLALEKRNLEVQIAGGKGKYSLKTPEELIKKFDNDKLVEYSRLIAKIDNNLVQDGYDLYIHFFISDGKDWAIIQQGLNEENSYARRYHWSNLVRSELNDIDKLRELINPHSSIEMNKTSEKSLIITKESNLNLQKDILSLKELSLSEVKKEIIGQKSIFDFIKEERKKIDKLPKRHNILKKDLSERDLEFFKKVKESDPKNFKELLKIKGVGKRGIRSLALISNIVFGTPIDWKDFVKYSYAHGGKDKIPYPVDKINYKNSIIVLREALEESKIGHNEKVKALKRLNKLFFPY